MAEITKELIKKLRKYCDGCRWSSTCESLAKKLCVRLEQLQARHDEMQKKIVADGFKK